jgi:hypothetical protein
MRNLALRLGKAKVDRIRYVTLQNTQRLAKSQNIDNTVMRLMQFKEPYADDCYVDDIVQGIARLDHQMTKGVSKPLNVSRLYNVLQCMPLINTREVMAMMDIDTRQAQKYVKACKLVIFHIHRHNAQQELAVTL